MSSLRRRSGTGSRARRASVRSEASASAGLVPSWLGCPMRLGKNGFAKRLRRLVVRDCYAGARLLVYEQFRVIVAIESMEEARDDAGEAF